jgi:hypothetical protein
MARLMLGVLVIVSGCVKPHYSFEPRPSLEPAASGAERCYQNSRFELALGSGSFTSYTSSPYATRTLTGQIAIAGTTTSRSFAESGLVVYRGGNRLDVRAALRELRDPAADQGYARVLAPTAGAYRSYPRWRTVSIVTSLLATAAVLGGTAWAATTGFEEDPPLYVMLGGAVGLLVSLGPTTGALLTKDDHFLHERKLRVFQDPAFAPVLVEGVRTANQRAAAACGHPTPDVPMTSRARTAIAR